MYSFLADKNTCVILSEFLNKVYNNNPVDADNQSIASTSVKLNICHPWLDSASMLTSVFQNLADNVRLCYPWLDIK